MRVLIACERSGTVRDAFIARGHDAHSCDLFPSDTPHQNHWQCDALEMIAAMEWDLMICHPPCTHLAVSGARWFPEKVKEQREALEFVLALLNASIPMICLENPISVISSIVREPDQIIQPWQFGDEAQKSTCLWLKNLPKLKPTKIVGRGKMHTTKGGKTLPEWYNLPPSEDRARLRAKTFPGIANAMAAQWGELGASHRSGLGIDFKNNFKRGVK